MAKEEVKEENVPMEGPFISPNKASDSKRYFEAKGFAWFSCPQKHNRWPSAHSWCFIDLKTQSICYRDNQGCRKCDSTIAPEFQRESVERMARYVVKKFLRRTGRRPIGKHSHHSASAPEEIQGGPHDVQRCGKCKRLGRSCWKTVDAI